MTLAILLRDLGFLLYGGPLVAFAIIIALVERIPGLEPWAAVRSFRAWGPGLGLALGATVLGALSVHYLQHGAFAWGIDSPGQRWELSAWVAFFLLWVSNIKLEVWTLEPLRKLDQKGNITDEPAYRLQTRRLARHLLVHALLVVLVVVLTRLSEASP